MRWQEQLKLPPNLFDNDWPSPETSDFWEVVYFDQEVESILSNQVPILFKKSPEVQKALATCYIWINSMASIVDDHSITKTLENTYLLSAPSISLIFHNPMTGYLLDQLNLPRPTPNEPFHLYLEKQTDIRNRLEELSPEMRDIAWWAFWGTFDSASQRSNSEFISRRPVTLNKKEAVDFMQNKLGLNPPKIIS